jgi:hypothetical protein
MNRYLKAARPNRRYFNQNRFLDGVELSVARHESEVFGDADMDFNLLFRWDWHEGEDHELEEFNDVNHRNGEFLVFWVGPRVFDCSDRAQRHS